MFGFLNVYKPKGITSFDVIRKLRKILKIKQIGHSGTLDPIAEGVLPICIGKSTKLLNYLQENKGYIATFQLGYSSETYDTEGTVIKHSEKKITKTELEKIINSFYGETEQTPPIFSAVKLNGKKLYEYARAGNINIKIPAKKINITKINLLNFDEKNQTAKIEVECSKGTYIRSIINDIGKKSGCGAVMTELIRSKSGKFTLSTAIELQNLTSEEIIAKNLINPLEVLSYNNVELNEEEYAKVIVGQKLDSKGQSDGEILLLTKENKLISIAKTENGKIKVIKVFV